MNKIFAIIGKIIAVAATICFIAAIIAGAVMVIWKAWKLILFVVTLFWAVIYTNAKGSEPVGSMWDLVLYLGVPILWIILMVVIAYI